MYVVKAHVQSLLNMTQQTTDLIKSFVLVRMAVGTQKLLQLHQLSVKKVALKFSGKMIQVVITKFKLLRFVALANGLTETKPLSLAVSCRTFIGAAFLFLRCERFYKNTLRQIREFYISEQLYEDF